VLAGGGMSFALFSDLFESSFPSCSLLIMCIIDEKVESEISRYFESDQVMN